MNWRWNTEAKRRGGENLISFGALTSSANCANQFQSRVTVVHSPWRIVIAIPSFLPPLRRNLDRSAALTFHQFIAGGKEGGGVDYWENSASFIKSFHKWCYSRKWFPSPRFRSTTFPPSILSTFLHFSREECLKGVSFFFLFFSPLHSLQRNESLDELKLIKNIWTIVKFVNLRKDREMGWYIFDRITSKVTLTIYSFRDNNHNEKRLYGKL